MFDRSIFIFFKHIFFLFYKITHNDDLCRKSLGDRARPPFLSLLLPNGLVVFSFHCPIKTKINKMEKIFVLIYPYICIIISIFVRYIYVPKIKLCSITVINSPSHTAALYIHAADCIIGTI